MKLVILTLALSVLASCTSKETFVYFGTYTKKSSEGIYVSKLNSKTGELSTPQLAAKLKNPSFVAIHPNKQFLYAVSEEGGTGALVYAFAIGKEGKLSKINQQSTKGNHPCHVSVDHSGKTLMVTTYNGANCIAFSIAADGKIAEGTSYLHKGRSLTDRQKVPHPHSINVSPDNKRAFVADLGMDKIVVYDLNSAAAKLSNPSFIKFPGGSGPRHLSFHPSGKFAYANLELTRQVAAMSYDSTSGKLTQIQVLSTLPAGAEATGSTAECLVHPNGKWLYVSNRGHDSIAVFAIDQQSGQLKMIEVEPTKGKTPRGFGIDPSGQFLIAGHQESDNISVLRINQQSGALEATSHTVNVSQTVNVRFLEK